MREEPRRKLWSWESGAVTAVTFLQIFQLVAFVPFALFTYVYVWEIF